MEPPSSIRVSVITNQVDGRLGSGIEEAVAATLSVESVGHADVRILLSTDDHLRDLNRRFRSVDAPTDVLTFPEGSGPDGDIAISVPTAARQAKIRGISLDQEILLLAIHGALHLAGYEDDTDEGRDAMVDRMNVIAERLGVPALDEWSSLHIEATA
jgi:rRNA maturation RNase YbeY